MQQRYMPLTVVAHGSASGSLRIRCADCGAVLPYQDAQERGWGFDANGSPFSSYYCGSDSGRRLSDRIRAARPHSHGANP